ncbi:MAG: 1-acyl-sn-glycerol-3-phosphate acyltransferase [Gammaproteobacteria bacterium]|nr:1-acyl-sn-glycerol-3-phosphate acyltransferase [Gammaproteobacteria bacterium]
MDINATVIIAVVVCLSLFVFIGQWANRTDWGSVFSNTIDGWLRLFCHYYHRLECDTLALPEQGGAIVVSNHISGLDPFLILAASRRPIHFMIASDQYHRFGLTWLFKLAGCIPVERGGRTDKAFRAALRALAEGKVVALFPQGGIHHGHEPPPRLKRGVHKLAQLSGAPVYPLHVSGVKGIGHVVRGVLLRAHARVEHFPPVDCASLEAQDCLAALAKDMKVTHH